MIQYTLKKEIPLYAIDLECSDFCFEYETQADRDEEQKRYASLYPPVFIRLGGMYKPVLGKKSILKLKQNKKAVQQGLLLTGIRNRLELITFIIHLKNEIGGFNPVEKSLALQSLYKIDNNIDPDILHVLDIPKNPGIIQKYLSLAGASDEVKCLICRGQLNEQTAFEIFKIKKEEWNEIAWFISTLSLGTKKRNDIVNMVIDISLRDQERPADIIHEKAIAQIMSLKNIDPLHRAEKIFHYLSKLRYPSIHEFRERFSRKLEEVGIAKKFHIMLPQDFERWKFKLVLSFSSAREFQNNIKQLQTFGEKESFKKLMSMRY
jgi:hypothetical protein